MRRRRVGWRRGDGWLTALGVVAVAAAAGLLWMSQRMVAPPRPKISESERPDLGLVLREAPSGGALVVRSVDPASVAGLLPGDRVVSVDGAPLSRPGDVAAAALAARDGRSLRLEARRPDPEGGEGGLLVEVAPKARPISPADWGLPFEEISFRNGAGLVLRGWYIPPKLAAGRSRAPGVAFGHGEETDRRQGLETAVEIHDAGIAQVLVDFAGRGESDGEVVTLGFHEAADLRAALDFLAGRREVDADRLGLVGRSMGGAAAILAAADDPRVRAVVADSSFADLGRLADETLAAAHVPPALARSLLFGLAGWRAGYDPSAVRPVQAIARVKAPVLLLHGAQDTVVPVAHAESLRSAVAGSCTLVILPGVGHDDPRPRDAVHRIATFLSRLL